MPAAAAQSHGVGAADAEVIAVALGPKWDKCLLWFQYYMTVIAIQDDVQRKELLLQAVEGNTFDILTSLADHGTTYNNTKDYLTK